MFYVECSVPYQAKRLALSLELEKLGIKDVYYYAGEHADVPSVYSSTHLAFDHEDDAIMFALSRGTTVLREPPKR